MKQTILVIAAHPDDEVLGCGGTIARHVAEGCDVHTLILAEGVTSRDVNRDEIARKKELSVLVETARSVGAFLGVRSVDLVSFPDNRMDTLPLLDVIKTVEKKIRQTRPSVVYTHYFGDLNIDHQVTHQAVVTACRPYPEQTVKTLLFFEIASSTDWQSASSGKGFYPNWFVDISGSDNKDTYVDKKLRALEMYADEMRSFPHARSIDVVKARALYCGAGVGNKAAEAFVLGRHRV
jgi:N-acetylglucosamine malate deacetylase 1